MHYASYCALAALFAASATACQKASLTPSSTDQGIIGEWHWVSTVGGLTGKQTYTPASTGSTQTWVFKSDSTYQHVTIPRGGPSGTETGTFSLGSIRSIHTGEPARALLLHGKQSQVFLMEEVTTRLVLSDNYYDGFGYTYEH
jgi:hypothetical protein